MLVTSVLRRQFKNGELVRNLGDYPAGAAFAMTELKLREEGGSQEMVCVLCDEKQPEALKAVLSRWAPELCVLVKSPAAAEKLSAIAPFTADMQAVDNKAAYYICKDGSCSLPIVQ